jgi:hypothetical protein
MELMQPPHAYGGRIFAGFSQRYEQLNELVPIGMCAHDVFPAFPGFARLPFSLELQK